MAAQVATADPDPGRVPSPIRATLYAVLLRFWPLGLAVAFVIAFWVWYPQAYSLSDPAAYAHNAHSIAAGRFAQDVYQSPFWHRIGVLLPVALVFRLFAVTPATATFVSLLSAIVIIAGVFAALEDRRSRAFGVLLAATSAPLLSATTELFPDVVATAWAMPCLLSMQRRRELSARPRSLLFAASAALSWFAAFLSKETAVWYLILWACLLVYDLRKSRRVVLRFHVPAAITGVALAAAYAIYCHVVFGSALARLQNVDHLVKHHTWAIGSAAALRARLGRAPLAFFWDEYRLVWILGVLGLATVRRERRFWAAGAIVTCGAFWFGPTALTHYTPLPLVVRMTLPCAPFLYVLSGDFLGRATRDLSAAWTLLVGSAVAVFEYTPVAALIATATPDLEAQALSLVGREAAREAPHDVLLVTGDKRSAELLDIYFGFEVPRNLTIRLANEVTPGDLRRVKTVFLFTNSGRSRYVHRTYRWPIYDRALHKLPADVVYSKKDIRLARSDDPEAIRTRWSTVSGKRTR